MENLEGIMMERYWNNLRSRLDRSTTFIASQSGRHTDSRLAGTSGRPTSQPRGATHNQFQASELSENPRRTSVITTAPPSARETVTSNSGGPSINWRFLHAVPSPGSSSASMATSSQQPHSRVPEPPSLSSFSRIRSVFNTVPEDETGAPLTRAMATGSQQSHFRVLEPVPVSHAGSLLNTGHNDDNESLSRRFRSFHSPTRRSEWRINGVGDQRMDSGVGGSQSHPLAGSQGSEVEVIVVDSDDDDDEVGWQLCQGR